jgi:hypothetical protein
MDDFVKLMDVADWALTKASKQHPQLYLEMEKQHQHVRRAREHPGEGKQHKILEHTAGFMTAWMVRYPDLDWFLPVIERLRGHTRAR